MHPCKLKKRRQHKTTPAIPFTGCRLFCLWTRSIFFSSHFRSSTLPLSTVEILTPRSGNYEQEGGRLPPCAFENDRNDLDEAFSHLEIPDTQGPLVAGCGQPVSGRVEGKRVDPSLL